MTSGDQPRLLVVSSDRALVERVAGATGGRCQVVRCEPDERQIAAFMGGSPPDLALVDLDDASWDGRAKTEPITMVRAHDESVPIVVTTFDISLNTIIPAMRAGACDVIDKDFATDELVAVVDDQLRRRPAKRGEETGHVYVLVGRRGGIGTTTVATALALDLSARLPAGRRVLLLDFSYPPPVVPDLLAIRTNYFMADAIGDMARLDPTLIEDAFARLPQKPLYVLALAPDEMTANQVDTGDFLNLLSLLRTYFTAIVVDLDAFWSAGFAQRLFTECDRMLLCCDQSIATMHASAVFLDALRDHLGREPDLSLVITRHAAELEPTVEELGSALGQAMPVHVVPDDRIRIDTLRNAGQPLLDGTLRTPFTRAIRRIVDTEMAEVDGRSLGPDDGRVHRLRPLKSLFRARPEPRKTAEERRK